MVRKKAAHELPIIKDIEAKMKADRTVPELFTDLVDNLSNLFRQEIQLAKSEAKDNVQEATGAIAYMAAGGMIALAGFIMLLHAASAWLAWAGIELRWGYLATGAIAAVVGLAMAYSGKRTLGSASVTPHRALNQLQRDAKIVKDQVK